VFIEPSDKPADCRVFAVRSELSSVVVGCACLVMVSPEIRVTFMLLLGFSSGVSELTFFLVSMDIEPSDKSAHCCLFVVRLE